MGLQNKQKCFLEIRQEAIKKIYSGNNNKKSMEKPQQNGQNTMLRKISHKTEHKGIFKKIRDKK